LARIGGDEFVVLCPNASDFGYLRSRAQQLIKVASTPIHWEDKILRVGASVGAALSSPDVNNEASMMQNADIALYEAKNKGRGQVACYDHAMDRSHLDKTRLASELIEALETNQLDVYLQPQCSLIAKAITGFEALIRWHHPTKGLLLPKDGPHHGPNRLYRLHEMGSRTPQSGNRPRRRRGARKHFLLRNAHLGRLRVDGVKIDKSMITGLASNVTNQIIVQAMVGLCSDLGLHVIAEGVTNWEDASMLRQFGCINIQGTSISEPMPIDAVENWMKTTDISAILTTHSKTYQYVYHMDGVSKTYPGGKKCFENIRLSFLPGVKIGVVGVNGAGKSTLMKIVRENVMLGVKDKKDILDRYNELAMNYSDETAEEMAKLQDEIDAQNLWDLDAQVDVSLEALRCPPDDADVKMLSGGEKRRVALCQLLLDAPDMLLLDEPTNHLDAETIAWLQQHLIDYKGTILIVTHDRYFLDDITGWILELDRGRGIGSEPAPRPARPNKRPGSTPTTNWPNSPNAIK